MESGVGTQGLRQHVRWDSFFASNNPQTLKLLFYLLQRQSQSFEVAKTYFHKMPQDDLQKPIHEIPCFYGTRRF